MDKPFIVTVKYDIDPYLAVVNWIDGTIENVGTAQRLKEVMQQVNEQVQNPSAFSWSSGA